MEIQFQNIAKSFGEKKVLHNVNWTIRDGDRWMIDGPSGFGKTTLLRLLMGLEKPSSGQITGTAQVRFATVFQENRLLPMFSAVQNLQLVCDWTTDEISAFLQQFLGFQDCQQPVSTLSGGMQRRVSIARALAAPSDILILDEPFTGLDHANIARISERICACTTGKTVIFSSHVPSTLFPDAKHLRLG